jgi:hypothetical protein
MPHDLPDKATKSDRWVNVRERPRKDGSIAHVVNYRLDGKQPTITFDNPEDAAAMAALIKAHGCRRALDMYGITHTARQPRPPGRRSPSSSATTSTSCQDWSARRYRSIGAICDSTSSRPSA